MKLLISALDALSGYVSREFFHTMSDLIRVHGWIHVEPSILWESRETLRPAIQDRFGRLPDVVLFWEQFELCGTYLRDLMGLPCRKFIFADDLHSNNEERRLLKYVVLDCFDTILSSYDYALTTFHPGLRGKHTIWIPHA